MKLFRKYQDKTEYSSGLENIRIYRQKIDWDYKVMKINLEKQKIKFSKTIQLQFMDKLPKRWQILSIEKELKLCECR